MRQLQQDLQQMAKNSAKPGRKQDVRKADACGRNLRIQQFEVP